MYYARAGGCVRLRRRAGSGKRNLSCSLVGVRSFHRRGGVGRRGTAVACAAGKFERCFRSHALTRWNSRRRGSNLSRRTEISSDAWRRWVLCCLKRRTQIHTRKKTRTRANTHRERERERERKFTLRDKCIKKVTPCTLRHIL